MNFISKKIAVLALACGMIFGMASMSQAAGPVGSDYGCPAYGMQLTPEQMEKARKIFTDNYAGMESTRQALAAKRAELSDQLNSTAPDRAKIESLSREIGELRGKLLSARAEVRANLAKEGLPVDFYGPNAPQRGYEYGPNRGWHHGHGPHHGGWGRGWHRGWGGCMGGCWQ